MTECAKYTEREHRALGIEGREKLLLLGSWRGSEVHGVGCVRIGPWKDGWVLTGREGEGISGRKDDNIKAEDGAQLKAQLICRKVLEDKFEKIGWAQIMRV